MGTCESRDGFVVDLASCADSSIEQYTPQGAEMVHRGVQLAR